MAKINLKISREKNKMLSTSHQEYPSLYLSNTPLPLIKKQIGKSLRAVVTLKFVGYNENNSTNKNHVSYDFAVQDIEFSGRDIAENNAKEKLNKVFGSK